MTRFSAETPADRRALVAEAVIAHRTRDSDGADFEAEGRRLTYADRVLTVRLGEERAQRRTDDERDRPLEGGTEPTGDDPHEAERGRAAERDRLDALLADYPVFKVEQPATRKAGDDVVYVSAIADPKHLADFVDDCFRRVYGLPDGYELWVARV